MIEKWKIFALTSEQRAQAESLAKELGVSLSICELLVIRGITTFEEAKRFFRPKLADLHDPFLIKDMTEAVARLNRALSEKEKILIYGDYDVDGTTAVSLVYGFLRQYTKNIGYYIPDRYSEGYGISMQSIDFAKNEGYNLIIALDCGIKAVDKVAKANEYGIDFIICDHHTPDAVLPAAVAVLDSQREDCTYPYRFLSGCGVGFKLLQAFSISNEIPINKLFEYLDLAAVSIASDIVPITGENRILAAAGMQKLNTSPNLGLKNIIDVCSMSGKPLDISDVVFKLGPRINAAGRMRTGNEIVELLTTNNADIAREKCSDVDGYNTERRDIDTSTTEQARQFVLSEGNIEDRKSIVVFNPQWNKGIVGIVASRLAEEFHRPTIVLTHSTNGDLISGSARSVLGFDLYSAIDSCRDLLENFGGHLYAAGLSMKEENFAEFKRRFEKNVEETITEEQLNPQIEVDLNIDFAEITPKFWRILKQFNPFGPENMKPVFCTKNLIDYQNQSKLIGKDSTHLRLVLSDILGKNAKSGVAFCSGDMRNYDMQAILTHLKNGGKVDICYTLEDNTFNGQTNLQIMVKDVLVVNG
ncbi:MAG: single-stranded-DNA-specific exonuclease RecJ [Prevotellaceae bacterium]|jgi:single-stranded-DNA-specific exonuclease|nr:single-stranded-DNA-specific exonuclease RecJ [Prevotellaceae bacterium]